MRIVRSVLFALALVAGLTATALAEPVDINRADATAIAAAMKGVGPKKAAEIVAHREKNGPFRSIEELTSVKGIGDRTLELNRDAIRIGSHE